MGTKTFFFLLICFCLEKKSACSKDNHLYISKLYCHAWINKREERKLLNLQVECCYSEDRYLCLEGRKHRTWVIVSVGHPHQAGVRISVIILFSPWILLVNFLLPHSLSSVFCFFFSLLVVALCMCLHILCHSLCTVSPKNLNKKTTKGSQNKLYVCL